MIRQVSYRLYPKIEEENILYAVAESKEILQDVCILYKGVGRLKAHLMPVAVYPNLFFLKAVRQIHELFEREMFLDDIRTTHLLRRVATEHVGQGDIMAATIPKYLQDHERPDIAHDKLTSRT